MDAFLHLPGLWKMEDWLPVNITLSAQECLNDCEGSLALLSDRTISSLLPFQWEWSFLCGWTLTGRGAALQKETWECWWVKTSGLCWGSVTSGLRNVVLHLCSALVRKHLEGWTSSGLPSLRETYTVWNQSNKVESPYPL